MLCVLLPSFLSPDYRARCQRHTHTHVAHSRFIDFSCAHPSNSSLTNTSSHSPNDVHVYLSVYLRARVSHTSTSTTPPSLYMICVYMQIYFYAYIQWFISLVSYRFRRTRRTGYRTVLSIFFERAHNIITYINYIWIKKKTTEFPRVRF